MNVNLLGTGSALPDGTRKQSGLLVSDTDNRLLIDAGSGILDAVARTEPGVCGVDTILLTHHHLDHVADLLPILKARWLRGEVETTIVGPQGTDQLLSDLLNVTAFDYLREPLRLEIREITPGEHSINGFTVETARTTHSMDGFAVKINDQFAFSGDTEADEAVARLADGAAVLVHDCSFPDEANMSNHASPTALGRVLTGCDVSRLYLTHLYPQTNGNHQSMREAITQAFDGEIYFADDGTSITITE